MALAWNVGSDFHAIGQPNTRDLAQCRVGLFGCHRADLHAHPPFERVALGHGVTTLTKRVVVEAQRWCGRLLLELRPAFTHELADCWQCSTYPYLPQDANRQVYGCGVLSGNYGQFRVPSSGFRVGRHAATRNPELGTRNPELNLGVHVGLFVVLEQILVVVVVIFEVFQPRRRAIDHADTRQTFAQRTAEGDRLAVFEQEAGRQRPGFEHELLLRGQPLAASLLARRQTRARRDELADDDVLLEAEQLVDLAGDRRLSQHLGRLLEG